MAEVSEWSLFAYFNGDEHGERDHTRIVPEWRLDDTLRWARHRGFDSILLTRLPSTVEYVHHPAPSSVKHFS